MNLKKPRLIIKERQIYFPRIPWVGITLPLNIAMRLPSIEGLALGQNPKAIIVLALLVSAGVISGAVYFAIQGINPAPIWPDAAVYDAARAQRLGQEEIGVGEKQPVEEQTPTMTLQLKQQ